MRFPAILAAACLLLASCKKEGCTDASAYNFNPDAELEDGTCQYSGCTDQLASNYDEGAAVNDGSCDYLGCTDSEALNYDETATIDDGSCVFLEDLQPSIDGYTYGVVQIGDQVWFSENLRTTTYANGDLIPAGLTDDEWVSTTSGATAVYGEGDSDCGHWSPDIDACDEVQSLAAYGRLYNWYAVGDVRGLCPAGWHVPTDDEWTELEDYITSQGFAGTESTALKSTAGWYNNGHGTDDFGFSALPGGYRYYSDYGDGSFLNAGEYGSWWSSSPSGGFPWCRVLVFHNSDIVRENNYPRVGFSVRCLRDAE